MPSRAYTSFLLKSWFPVSPKGNLSVNALSGLYLISTDSKLTDLATESIGVNALSGLYLIST